MPVLVNNLAATVPGFNVNVTATWEQNKCSYEVLFTDISTPTVGGYENVTVEYFYDDVLITSSEEGQTCSYYFKEESNYTIRQVYTIYAVDLNNPNSRSEILFQADNEFLVVVNEWKPFFSFSELDQCYVRGEIDIIPATVQLNNNVCGILPEPNTGYLISESTPGTYSNQYYVSFNSQFQTLSYRLYKYDMDLAEFIEIGEAAKEFSVTTSIPSDYVFNFETQVLGTYKLVGTLSNCCMEVTDEVIFSTCDAVKLEPSCLGQLGCDDCKGYNIVNETIEEVSVTVTDVISGKQIHDMVVAPLSTYGFTPTQDGVYRFDWNDESAVLIHSCAIYTCYHKLQKLLLCRTSGECCDDSYLESRLATIQPMYQTYQRLFEPYADLNVRYTNENISEIVTDLNEIGKLQEQLLEFCDVCANNCSGCWSGNTGTCI